MEWIVLDRDEPAMRLGHSLGVEPLEGWNVDGLPGDALLRAGGTKRLEGT
jgi:hypothetical protein